MSHLITLSWLYFEKGSRAELTSSIGMETWWVKLPSQNARRGTVYAFTTGLFPLRERERLWSVTFLIPTSSRPITCQVILNPFSCISVVPTVPSFCNINTVHFFPYLLLWATVLSVQSWTERERKGCLFLIFGEWKAKMAMWHTSPFHFKIFNHSWWDMSLLKVY